MRFGALTSGARWSVAFAALLASSAAWVPTLHAQQSPPAPDTLAFRLFLEDGMPIVTLGEYTRAGGRVIFSLPVGPAASPDSVQLVSLPDEVIDWERTSRYTDSLRARRYADTRGAAEYKALVLDVARSLTEMAVTPEPARRLAVAEQARKRLLEWPRSHFAYRAEDVGELAMLLDEAIAGIRADMGEQSFSFDLVAMTEPPTEPLLPASTFQESIDQAMTVARLSDVPAERMSLEEAILVALDPARQRSGQEWMTRARRSVEAALRADQRTDDQYTRLTRSALGDAASRAGRADVKGIERLLEDVRREDDKLGQQRPGRMAALVQTLESYRGLAERRRLSRQIADARAREHAEYWRGAGRVFGGMQQIDRDIEAVRAQAGLDGRRLRDLGERLSDYSVALAKLTAPSELAAAHGNLITSIRLMQEAARLGLLASRNRSPEAARNASAAAAGAQLLLTRARSEIVGFFEVPDVR